MGRKVTLATCTLNQWAMDFDGNLKRILKSKCGYVDLLFPLMIAVFFLLSAWCCLWVDFEGFGLHWRT